MPHAHEPASDQTTGQTNDQKAPLTRGLYTARLARSPADLAASLALRQACFRGGQDSTISDADAHDPACQHMLITQGQGGLVASFRVQLLPDAGSLPRSYAAQFYDLAPLTSLAGPMLELGRFCVAEGQTDPDILRLAWASLTRMVDASHATLLFGCTSFAGADPARHAAAFGHLARHHLGPHSLRPGKRAAHSTDLLPSPMTAPAVLPPLLKTYLAMGGWVSDHAVLDRDLDTAHVFTALQIAAIPAARARALRALV